MKGRLQKSPVVPELIDKVGQGSGIGQITTTFSGEQDFTSRAACFFEQQRSRALGSGLSSSHQSRCARADHNHIIVAWHGFPSSAKLLWIS
jgi:hypothetical protein